MELKEQTKTLFAKASKEFKDLELKKKKLENEAKKLQKQLAEERKSQQRKLNDEAAKFRLNLAKEKENVLAKAKTKLEEVTKLETKLAEEKNRVQDQNLKAAKKVLLDVGGVFYSTNLTTLTFQPDSILVRMFSGRFPFGEG
jgi:predicted RNase H-like nuclease (RuvC/YqgF family)